MKPVVILCALGGESDDPLASAEISRVVNTVLIDAAKRLADQGFPVRYDGVATRMDDYIASPFAPDPERIMGSIDDHVAMMRSHLTNLDKVASSLILAEESIAALHRLIRIMAVCQVVQPGLLRTIAARAWSKRSPDDSSASAITLADATAAALSITAANMVAAAAYRFVGG